MPQVASHTHAHAAHPPHAHPARSSRGADETPASPFEELLAALGADPATQPQADDQAGAAAVVQPAPGIIAKPAIVTDKPAQPVPAPAVQATASTAVLEIAVAPAVTIAIAKPVERDVQAPEVKPTDADKSPGKPKADDPIRVLPNAAITLADTKTALADPPVPVPAPAANPEVVAPKIILTPEPVAIAADASKQVQAVLPVLSALPKSAVAKAKSDADAPPADPAPATSDTKAQSETALNANAAKGSAKPDAPVHGEPAPELHRTTTIDIAAAPANEHRNAAPGVTTDAAQTFTLSVPTQQAAPVAHAATDGPLTLPAAAVPLAGVAIEIAGKALEGKNRFEIRLDPPELGRIEVHLDVDVDGRVTSHLMADRPETLDLLRNDAPSLQRALQDAGLKTSDNGLQFSLRDQGTYQQQQQQQQQQANAPAVRLIAEDQSLPAPDLAAQNYSLLAARNGGIDIRV